MKSQVRVAVDARRIDQKLLIFPSIGVICCRTVAAFLSYWGRELESSLAPLVREHFHKDVFGAMVDLDVPTLAAARGRFDCGSWNSFSVALTQIFSFVGFVGKICVLATAIGC